MLLKRFLTIKVRVLDTLLEMLVVLIIISVLLLLFVPNLSQQKDKVTETGSEAVVKVVESQAELYDLSHADEANLSQLVESGSITAEQSQTYKEYFAKHTDKTPRVAP